jgi:hypothetical protein
MDARQSKTRVAHPRSSHPVETEVFSPRRPQHGARRTDDLHVCPSCSSGFVYPIDWAPAHARSWAVDLRCPECEWTGGGTYTQAVVDRFDAALDDGTESLLDDLNALTRANMEEQIESFVDAIWSDRILPEDF